ncbi:MAG TPA: AAA family ATPase [Gammaproteobacteria bacterium]|nr:AAA family ATPase [Gammaproteobacteria bacterium]
MHEAPASTPPQDTAAIFLTHAWEERLEIIRHLIDHSRQILLILGDAGSGKSTLRGHLTRVAPAAWRVVTLDAAPFDDALTLVERLATGLGMTPGPKDQLEVRTRAMEEHLKGLHHTGALPVALIDDAHQLPADALLLLLRLATSGADAPLRVVLFCDPRVTRLLESPQLLAYQRAILHTVEMPAYTVEETAAFLVWWHTHTGRDPNLLVEARVRAVYQASQGLPGRILALDAGRLTQEPQKNIRVITHGRSHRMYFVGAAVLLLLVVLMVFIWRAPTPAEKSPEPVAPEAPPSNAITTAPVRPPASLESSPMQTPTVPEATTSEKISPIQANIRTADNRSTKISPPPAPAVALAARLPKASAVDGNRVPKDDAWLRKQSPDRYVIQLFGSHDQGTARKYAERPDLAGHTAIYTTQHDQQPLHVVVYGLYDNRAEAVTAIDRLPADVVRQKPFPRSVGEVQRLMNAGP